MSIDFEKLLKSLGLPVGLVAVVYAVLDLFGLSLDTIITVAESLVGAWAVVALLINIGKVLGFVTNGNAGKWSAGLNLVVLGAVAYVLYINPTFDFTAVDEQFKTFAEFGSLLLVYFVNFGGTKAAHKFLVNGLGIKSFSFDGSA